VFSLLNWSNMIGQHLREWRYLGEMPRGYCIAGTFQVKPVQLHSRIRLTEWETQKVIGFESIEGFRNWSTWRFRADGPSRAKIEVVFSYELPGGLAGRAIGLAPEPIVALTILHTDEALRREIEAWYQQGAGRPWSEMPEITEIDQVGYALIA
jgi:uncharacterized membrane protein